MSPLPVLVVQHEPECPPGWVGEWLTERGAHLDVRHPYAADRLPADLTSHSGLLVLGGHMGANDDADAPWLRPTRALIRLAAATATPALGICLGHQLAAVALGGEVRRNPLGQQVGLQDVGWLPAAASDALLARLSGPVRAVQWNHDVVTLLPARAEALARSPRGELQAARFAPTVWGVQWHPEVGGDIVQGWAGRQVAEQRPGHDDGSEPDAEEVLAGAASTRAAEAELRRTWRPLADSFADLVAVS